MKKIPIIAFGTANKFETAKLVVGNGKQHISKNAECGVVNINNAAKINNGPDVHLFGGILSPNF